MKNIISQVSKIDKQCLLADKSFIDFVEKESCLFYNILMNIEQYLSSGYTYLRQSGLNNVWYPSLGLGIPVTKKDDAYHQVTYIIHDFVHHLLKDPLPSESLPVYVVYKMVGEVISQYIADYLFIKHVMKKYDNSYNSHARKYYYFVEDNLKGESDFSKKTVDFLFGIVRFSINNTLQHVTENSTGFINKYTAFFQADLYWNTKNHNIFQITGNIEPLENKLNILESKSSVVGIIEENIDLLQQVGRGDLITASYNKALHNHISAICCESVSYNRNKYDNDKIILELKQEYAELN